MMRTRRTFTAEFYQEAAALVRQTGKSESRVARKFGQAERMQIRWVQHDQPYFDWKSVDDAGRSPTLTAKS